MSIHNFDNSPYNLLQQIGVDRDVRVKQPFHVTYKKKINGKKDLLMTSLTEFYSQPGKIAELLPIIRGESKISLRIIDWFVTNYSKKKNIGYQLQNEKQFIVYLNYKSQLRAYSKKQFDPFCRRERISYYYDTAEEKLINTSLIKKKTPKKNNLKQEDASSSEIENNDSEIQNEFVDTTVNSAVDMVEDDLNKNEEDVPEGTQELITTVGQLNFFRWAIDNDVLKFIQENLTDIEEDMNVSIRPIYNNRNRKKSLGETKRRKRHELSVSATKSISKHDVQVVIDFN